MLFKKVTVLLFCCAAILFSQPEIIWDRLYDNEGNADIGWDITSSCDSGFIIVGSTGPSRFRVGGREYKGLIIKTDSLGNAQIIKICSDTESSLLTSVIRCNDGYIAAGSRYITGMGRQAWLVKFDKNLIFLWEKTFGGKKDDNAKQIIPVDDKNFFVIGDTKSYGKKDGKSDIWLMKIDINGNLIWSKTYDSGAEDMGTSIDKFGNDGFIFSSVSVIARGGSLLQAGFTSYFIIDKDGNVIKFRDFKEGKKNHFTKIRATLDGGAIIVGNTSIMEIFPSEDVWIIKINRDGDIEWSKIINTKKRYDGAFDVIQMTENMYIIAGYSQIEKDERIDFDNFLLLGIDSKGNVCWKKEWGGKDNDDLYSIVKIDTETIIVAGFKNAVSWPLKDVPGNSDIYVVKVKLK